MNKKIRVLYVEDEPNIAKLLASGLGLFGIDVHPAMWSGEDLLEKMETPDFKSADILIFDIRLPRMTGLELANELRLRGEHRPIVLVSAWPSPSKEQLKAVQAAFLPKPFDFPDVVQTIQRLALQPPKS
jgi:CheY-like chemotaxis protein